jgi:hypothetical protein
MIALVSGYVVTGWTAHAVITAAFVESMTRGRR